MKKNKYILPITFSVLFILLYCSQKFNPTTVKIGNQVWMAENLNVVTFRNGDHIPEAYTNKEWEKMGKKGKPAWCYYDNDPNNNKTYGKLYNWYAVNDPRGLAPKHWHVPSDDEWQILVDYLGGDKYAGPKLKSSHDWYKYKDGNGSNSSGFSAIPGGIRFGYGSFDCMGGNAVFWSATERSSNLAWHRVLRYGHPDVYRGSFSKQEGMSVRLVKD